MAENDCPHCGESTVEQSEACAACGHFHVTRNCEIHKHREADGQCVVCGTALCEECNQPQGRHFVCAEHAAVPLMAGWAQVYSAAGDVEAELVRENLSAEGIDSRVLSQRDHNVIAVDIGELNQVRVLVPAFEYGAAADLLAEHMLADGEILFACPACGEAFDEGATTCASCGEPLPTQA